ncbi:MAG TPA: glucose-6-phosphate dehydrogenase assembly protein OpcA, partial [Isosphaeraceae bacterium]
APGLPQVCSERIVLRAGPEALELLPGAVRSLLEADLPTILWWADDPRTSGPLFRDLAADATRLLVDLPDPRAEPAALRAALDLEAHPYARDLSWFAITRWRELVAQLFDPPTSAETLARIDTVRIRAQAPSRDRPARAACWLAAWLAAQLGWEPRARHSPGPGRLEATFRGPAGEVAVSIRTGDDPDGPVAHLTGVTLATRDPGGPGIFRLERPSPGADEVQVLVSCATHCALPRRVLAPEIPVASRVAAALESSRDDPPFRSALPILLWMLEA